MQSIICRGCRKILSSHNAGKNIFSDDILTSSHQSDQQKTPSEDNRMKIYSGIELIIGQPVAKKDGLPNSLCKECYQKLEAFCNFRGQLLTSLEFLNSQASQITSNRLLANTGKCGASKASVLCKDKGKELFKAKEMEDTNLDNSEISESKSESEDLINVEDHSTSSDSNVSINEEPETNCSTLNSQESNNHNDSDSSNDYVDSPCSPVVHIKIQDNNIESEIDVCSGDDDEILELDIESKKDEIVEIGSSAESDSEVCDYEPTGKRIKNYNMLSLPVRF